MFTACPFHHSDTLLDESQFLYRQRTYRTMKSDDILQLLLSHTALKQQTVWRTPGVRSGGGDTAGSGRWSGRWGRGGG